MPKEKAYATRCTTTITWAQRMPHNLNCHEQGLPMTTRKKWKSKKTTSRKASKKDQEPKGDTEAISTNHNHDIPMHPATYPNPIPEKQKGRRIHRTYVPQADQRVIKPFESKWGIPTMLPSKWPKVPFNYRNDPNAQIHHPRDRVQSHLRHHKIIQSCGLQLFTRGVIPTRKPPCDGLWE